ncbi:periplasmic nitrate reductase, NapE protein [Vibrio sp.]|uniref:periplasmic nitrate reductase, NapE protein n=1 Tax=Vibrio sp. TaxID=678 RepID=UPI003D0DFE5F
MSEPTQDKKQELVAHGLITFLLFPILTVAGIGLYGLIVWLNLALGGMPGH